MSVWADRQNQSGRTWFFPKLLGVGANSDSTNIDSGYETARKQKESLMRPILMVLASVMVAVCFSSCATSDQTTASSTPSAASTAVPTENVEQALMQVEREWVDALLKRDTAALERILADDWAGISWDGKNNNKAQAIADLQSALRIESINLEPMKVRVLGDTAVVTGGDTEKTQYEGKDISGRYLWTDVFVNRDGRWQAVASQSTRVEQPKP